LDNLEKLCIHSITTKPWSIDKAIDQYSAHGVTGITVWRQALEGHCPKAVGERIKDNGMKVISLCRGGFLPALDHAGQTSAIKDNLTAIEQAADLGAPLIVLVPGAVPGQSLDVSRSQIRDGIRAILPKAVEYGIKLGVEPLHPMYADTRSAINSLKQANDFCDEINSPNLGLIVDVYHLWWEPDLQKEIQRCGEAGRIFAFHICDWKTPTLDLLNDRGLMGEGCINLPQIREWVENAGFDDYHEVEIFSDFYWQMDQEEYLKQIIDAYKKYC